MIGVVPCLFLPYLKFECPKIAHISLTFLSPDSLTSSLGPINRQGEIESTTFLGYGVNPDIAVVGSNNSLTEG